MLKDVNIENRHSIRKFKKGEEISEEVVSSILEAGMKSPSAMNTRPWSFVVIYNQEVKEKLLEVHPRARMVLDASFVIIVVAEKEEAEKVCKGYWIEDCSASIENMLIEATAHGVGSCWCGVYPNEARVEGIAKLLDIKKGIPFALLAFGIPDEIVQTRGYLDLSKVRIIK